ncbi:hypothetical protein ACP70R_047797 [Stipagrostis hirtigluma subsp. patula]
MARTTDRRAAVALFALPFQGNLSPMLQLAGALHARGLAVTVLHAAAFDAPPDPARHRHPAGLAFVPVPVAVPDEAADDGVAKTFALNAAMEASGCARDALASLLKPDSEEAPRLACVVVDAALPAAHMAAADLGLPRLVLNTGSAACLRMFRSYDMLYRKGYLPSTESNLDLPVKELPPLKVRDLWDPSKLPNKESVQKTMDMWIQTKKNSGDIINTFEALEGRELETIQDELGITAFAVGPLHKLSYIDDVETSLLEADRTCIEWLNKQAPSSVLYVSFGSVANVTKDEFVEIAWGLANSGKPFLWVVRHDLVLGVEKFELPKGFECAVEGRGKVIEWAPQREVLAHPAVGGFWTHSGWNSTLESICEGVPMLSRPIFGDQLVNGRYVEDVWKIGFLLVGVLEQGKIERAIRRLMEEKEGTEARERANDFITVSLVEQRPEVILPLSKQT